MGLLDSWREPWPKVSMAAVFTRGEEPGGASGQPSGVGSEGGSGLREGRRGLQMRAVFPALGEQPPPPRLRGETRLGQSMAFRDGETEARRCSITAQGKLILPMLARDSHEAPV